MDQAVHLDTPGTLGYFAGILMQLAEDRTKLETVERFTLHQARAQERAA